MADDAAEIRGLIDAWAQAVHGGDLDSVLAQHSGDIVLFDVPPPHQGIRGLAAQGRRPVGRHARAPLVRHHLRGRGT
ncbi:MAG: hypothetical protein ABWY29_08925 [Blastococcus sp.]